MSTRSGFTRKRPVYSSSLLGSTVTTSRFGQILVPMILLRHTPKDLADYLSIVRVHHANGSVTFVSIHQELRPEPFIRAAVPDIVAAPCFSIKKPQSDKSSMNGVTISPSSLSKAPCWICRSGELNLDREAGQSVGVVQRPAAAISG